MPQSKRICVICKKACCGDGVWSKPIDEPALFPINSICPDCCHKRYPHFYDDYEKPEGMFKKKIRGLFDRENKE